MEVLTFDILFSFITLVILEIILGIDNLIFISLAVAKLPYRIRKKARIFGLSLALGIRILMLFALSWVMSLTQPLFYLGNIGFSFKNFLLIFGGLFLILKSGIEIFQDVFGLLEVEKPNNKQMKMAKNLFAIALQISLIDLVFSFDSIMTAIAMTTNIPVIVSAVFISMVVMVIASEKIHHFMMKYPTLKIVALAFIFIVGVILLADGLHIHISKGYIYFALFFTMAVEVLNIIARKHKKNH
jgi:predicted tellurium resistance membrane protein TerC